MREPFAGYIATELKDDFLLIVTGLPGTWKTETCEEVARLTGYPLLRTDLIRLEVLKNEDVFDEKVAANMDKRVMVYEEMFRQADEQLEKGRGVVLDATFVTQALRRQAAAIAAKYQRGFVIMQTDCPQEVSIARILRRTREKYESNALTEQAYLNNKKGFEAIDMDELKKLYPSLSVTHFIVDTSHDKPEDWYVTSVVRR